ncbi:hypothetical protein BMF94_6321 [Rhodotorula taiwanensis]|uniref:Signal recognition particle subunit SRP14 n=1 Tax=Rhodotorula taiwanensis TaxID=741276 RepID=A0A2S5B1N5_9BASI|nr:hypothetical protein BMF94_6321 [Rhodotorula taiwanensis]
MHLSNSEFLDQLAALFAQRKEAGSVFLTQKRLTYDAETSTSSVNAKQAGQDAEMSDAVASSSSPANPTDAQEWPLLIRATDGKSKKDTKVKLSTTVQSDDVESFLAAYSNVLKSTFSAGLRPKRRKGDLAKQRAAKLAKRQAAKAKAKGGDAAGSTTKATSTPSATAAASSAAAGTGFVPRLPKVVGPRRGNGVQKRRRLIKRREKAVERAKASRTRVAAE